MVDFEALAFNFLIAESLLLGAVLIAYLIKRVMEERVEWREY